MNMKIITCLILLNVLIVNGHWEEEKCQEDVNNELIWEYDVRRSYRIGAYQEVEAEYGPRDVTITCIEMNSLSKEENGAAWVTAGGIGYNYIKVKFRSKYSRGLHYRVFVYGKPINKRNVY